MATQFGRSTARQGKQNYQKLQLATESTNNSGFLLLRHVVEGTVCFIIRRLDRWYRNENGSVAVVDPRYDYARLPAPCRPGRVT